MFINDVNDSPFRQLQPLRRSTWRGRWGSETQGERESGRVGEGNGGKSDGMKGESERDLSTQPLASTLYDLNINALGMSLNY
jgi:hypothetical protein